MSSPAQAAGGRSYRFPDTAAPLDQLRPPRLRRDIPARRAAGYTEIAACLLRDLPSVVALLFRLTRDPRVSRLDKLLLASAATYLVIPHDVIPDWIPVLGQLDDLLVIAVTVHRLLDRAGPDLLMEHWQGDPYTLELLLDGIERVRRRL